VKPFKSLSLVLFSEDETNDLDSLVENAVLLSRSFESELTILEICTRETGSNRTQNVVSFQERSYKKIPISRLLISNLALEDAVLDTDYGNPQICPVHVASF